MDDKPPIPLRQRPDTSTKPIFHTSPDHPRLPPPPPRALYIHVPFCFHKCHYCDFYSIVDSQDRQTTYLDRLVRELCALAPFAAGTIDSIFIGGGTPTLLAADLWRRLLDTLNDLYPLAPTTEFTVECNPETATTELFDILAEGGVNRLSIGAQTFHPDHLKTLERWHDPVSVPRALDLARNAGIARLSLDLIYAIPGQTLDDFKHDLDTALSLGTEHLSCYSLTYEPGTAMTKRLELGEFEPTNEDLDVELFLETGRVLQGAGLERYEVSNFARPGAECRHNLAYWRQEPWLAAGPSASGHYAGWRWKSIPRLGDYLALDDEGFATAIDIEPPDARRALAERIMTGLRLSEGLDALEILSAAADLSPESHDQLARSAQDEIDAGTIALVGGRWTLTDSGLLLADGIAARLMGALDP